MAVDAATVVSPPRRYRPRTEPRARTLSRRFHLPMLVRADRATVTAEDLAAVEASRPKTRGECASVPRPCPFVGCRYSLFLDASPNGSIKLNWPGREPGDMPPAASCALDVADRRGATLDVVGLALNLTRERIRQEERRIGVKLRTDPSLARLAEVIDDMEAGVMPDIGSEGTPIALDAPAEAPMPLDAQRGGQEPPRTRQSRLRCNPRGLL